MNERIIGQVPLFSTLPEDELRHLAQTLRPEIVAPGMILFREGERGDRFYIVLEGEIEIVQAIGTADQRLIAVRGPGQYVGEMSLIHRDGLRTASARAHTTAATLVMTRADFDALLQRQPTLAYEMVRVLSLRLQQAHNTALQDLREKNQALTEALQALQAAQAQIVEKKQLEHELQLAHDMQASLLPRAAPRLPGWEIAASWLPARNVSGDFYDFIPLDLGDGAPDWGLAIADVAGKGMPAALFMAVSRSIVRASLAAARSPAEGITQANRLIAADADRGMFVTLFYAQLNPMTGEMTYVNAGHNPAWWHAFEQDAWIELTGTGMALGIIDVHTLQQRTVQLCPGDFVLLYTDGLTDVANAQGEWLGADPVRRVLQAHRDASAAEIIAAVEQLVTRFRGDQAPFDDITLMVVKRNI